MIYLRLDIICTPMINYYNFTKNLKLIIIIIVMQHNFLKMTKKVALIKRFFIIEKVENYYIRSKLTSNS